jgi:hypothetical protein
VYVVVDCFNAEPLALREAASNEEVELSLEASDMEDDLGVSPGRCCEVR